jgi:hypothetical protein
VIKLIYLDLNFIFNISVIFITKYYFSGKRCLCNYYFRVCMHIFIVINTHIYIYILVSLYILYFLKKSGADALWSLL